MDYTFNETICIPYDVMIDWMTRLYEAMGLSPEDAFICADTLVEADGRGVYSHGICRNTIYYGRLCSGGCVADARPEIIRDHGAVAVVDGHDAMGQVTSHFAMKAAIEKARQYGTCAISVTGGNHFGTCAYYAMMAAKENMIGFVWTINGGNIMAPWGGCDARLGNNPFGVAIPCSKHDMVVLDLATSVVARGKILMAMKTGTPIPETWAFDREGRPTTDALEGYLGLVRPMADYKGYGITYINAIISAILNGSSFGENMPNTNEELDRPQNMGHLFQVIDIAAVTDVEEFKKRMDDSVDYLKSGKRSAGVEEILVPGEIEARCLKRQKLEGITYPVEVVEESRALSRKLGVEIPKECLFG